MNLKKNPKEEGTPEVNKLKITILILAVGVILTLLFFPGIKEVFKPVETRWCSFDYRIPDYSIRQCAHIKIISKDMHKVDFEKFLSYEGFYCNSTYELLPPCDGEEYFLNELSLSDLSDTNQVSGRLCAGYYLTFLDSNSTFNDMERDLFRASFSETLKSHEEVKNKLMECE